MLDSIKDSALSSKRKLADKAAADKGVLAMVIFNQLQDAFFVFMAWFFISWFFLF
jgi:hypothetical protein